MRFQRSRHRSRLSCQNNKIKPTTLRGIGFFCIVKTNQLKGEFIVAVKNITANEVLDKFDANEALNVIDVREDDEVANGVIPGALHIPLGQIADRQGELNKDTAYIIVCHAGGRSFTAASYLDNEGFNVTNMEGGMSAWEGELEF